jgi:hypothetical protein
VAILTRTKLRNAFKEVCLTSTAFIDDHIAWMRSNSIEHAASAQVQRQLLNHLMVIHEAFNNFEKLFSKRYNPITSEKLSLYKKIYLLGRSKNDIPECINKECEMENELKLFLADEKIQEEIAKAEAELIARKSSSEVL